MDWLDALMTTGAIGLIVLVATITFWVCAIVAFFSIAINASRIRRDVEAMRDMAEVEFHARATTAQAPAAHSRYAPPHGPAAPPHH